MIGLSEYQKLDLLLKKFREKETMAKNPNPITFLNDKGEAYTMSVNEYRRFTIRMLEDTLINSFGDEQFGVYRLSVKGITFEGYVTQEERLSQERKERDIQSKITKKTNITSMVVAITTGAALIVQLFIDFKADCRHKKEIEQASKESIKQEQHILQLIQTLESLKVDHHLSGKDQKVTSKKDQKPFSYHK